MAPDGLITQAPRKIHIPTEKEIALDDLFKGTEE